MKTHVNLLKEFLSENGITAEFTYNLKHTNRRPVKTIEELIKYIHVNRHPLRNAIFLAFYWDIDMDDGRGRFYWSKFADLWRKKLGGLNEFKKPVSKNQNS